MLEIWAQAAIFLIVLAFLIVLKEVFRMRFFLSIASCSPSIATIPYNAELAISKGAVSANSDKNNFIDFAANSPCQKITQGIEDDTNNAGQPSPGALRRAPCEILFDDKPRDKPQVRPLHKSDILGASQGDCNRSNYDTKSIIPSGRNFDSNNALGGCGGSSKGKRVRTEEDELAVLLAALEGQVAARR